MLEQQEREQAQIPESGDPSDRGDNLHLDADTNSASRASDDTPTTVTINLGIEPAAYRYESWSEMADGWVESVRSTAMTMPDPDREQIRDVTPLVPLEDVEALVEQLIASRQIGMAHGRSDAREATSSQ